MQQHMEAANNCAKAIVPLLDAMARGDFEEVATQRALIDELEHEADSIKHEIRSNLPRRLFMAIERRDMLEILDCQDSIADVTQDVAEMAALRGMVTPPSLVEPLAALALSALDTCAQSSAVVNKLDELVETGFGRHEISRIEEMITKLNELESRADVLGEDALRALFAIEDEIGVGAYYWCEIIRWIGDIADYAERAGNRIRLLIAA
jgi:hypothetical protein